jgi:hypothetical protein
VAGKGWDLTSTSSIQAAAAWLLKAAQAGGGGALMVAIIRVDDLAIAADLQLAPRDSVALLEDRMPELHERLNVERAKLLAKQAKKV